MKIPCTLIVLSSLLAGISPVSAQQEKVSPSHRAAIEKLFEASQQKDQYEVAMIAGFESAMGPIRKTMPPAEAAKFDQVMVKVRDFMVEKMGWEVIKPELVEVYAKHVSEAEIKAVMPHISSPAMQTLISKQIVLLPEASALGARKAQELQPEIMRIVQEEMSR